ncbi:MAG: hypothetical protein M3Y85_06360, partial [Bacteroidota bacterium]|nr:hypothetical protein [Bacteroidota bacterium]
MRKLLATISVISVFFIGCYKDHGDGTVISNPTDGQIVVSTYNSNLSTPAKLSILSKEGVTMWEKATPSAAVNFRKWMVNNKLRYT